MASRIFVETFSMLTSHRFKTVRRTIPWGVGEGDVRGSAVRIRMKKLAPCSSGDK